tara:strand:- start:19873 stop:20109 length:237 start_codon:yes stop_codon:yes gene_type:complete
MVNIVDLISVRYRKVYLVAFFALALCLYAAVTATQDLERITWLFGEKNAYAITQSGGSLPAKNLGSWQQFVVCVHSPK